MRTATVKRREKWGDAGPGPPEPGAGAALRAAFIKQTVRKHKAAPDRPPILQASLHDFYLRGPI
jgi:hypothetical protein